MYVGHAIGALLLEMAFADCHASHSCMLLFEQGSASTGRPRADHALCLQAAGIPETLVRLSVGVEDTADLIQDIQQALAAAGIKNCHVSNGGAPH